MNRIDKFPFAIVVLVFIASLVTIRCKDDSGESAADKTKRLLQSTTWKLDRLTVDNVDQTSLYPDLILTIANGTYTSQNGEPVWSASGTWSLIEAMRITRDNSIEITIDALDETKLTLSFEWTDTTFGSGRKRSIGGAHVFEFVKD